MNTHTSLLSGQEQGRGLMASRSKILQSAPGQWQKPRWKSGLLAGLISCCCHKWAVNYLIWCKRGWLLPSVTEQIRCRDIASTSTYLVSSACHTKFCTVIYWKTHEMWDNVVVLANCYCLMEIKVLHSWWLTNQQSRRKTRSYDIVLVWLKRSTLYKMCCSVLMTSQFKLTDHSRTCTYSEWRPCLHRKNKQNVVKNDQTKLSLKYSLYFTHDVLSSLTY